LYEALLGKLMSKFALKAALRIALRDDEDGFHCKNAILVDGPTANAVGCVLSYPAEHYGASDVVKHLLPKKILSSYGEFLTDTVPGSLYLHALSVSPQARGHGVGRLLVDAVVELSKSCEANGVSLHVRGRNEVAMRLYGHMGFQPVKTYYLPTSDSGTPDEEMILVHRK